MCEPGGSVFEKVESFVETYWREASGDASVKVIELNGFDGRAFARGFDNVGESDVKITWAI